MTKLKLRRATIEDINEIYGCLANLAAFLGETHLFELTPKKLETHGFGEHPAFIVVVAENSEKLAGICLYFPTFSTWYGTPGIYVQDLYIRPEYRGQKLGEKLLAAAACEARADGATHLRLSVDKANKQAMAFYDRLGMSVRNAEEIRMLDGADFQKLASTSAD